MVSPCCEQRSPPQPPEEEENPVALDTFPLQPIKEMNHNNVEPEDSVAEDPTAAAEPLIGQQELVIRDEDLGSAPEANEMDDSDGLADNTV